MRPFLAAANCRHWAATLLLGLTRERMQQADQRAGTANLSARDQVRHCVEAHPSKHALVALRGVGHPVNAVGLVHEPGRTARCQSPHNLTSYLDGTAR